LQRLRHLQRSPGRRRLTELTSAALSNTVRSAVALVCGADGASLNAGTALAELDADSLVRVGIADVVEAELARGGIVVHIDDATLGRVTTLGEIDAYLAPLVAVSSA
jgi:Phosphopantetheine attachment site